MLEFTSIKFAESLDKDGDLQIQILEGDVNYQEHAESFLQPKECIQLRDLLNKLSPTTNDKATKP